MSLRCQHKINTPLIYGVQGNSTHWFCQLAKNNNSREPNNSRIHHRINSQTYHPINLQTQKHINSKTHQLKNLPPHQLTNLPLHQFTNSKTFQFTSSSTHQLENLNIYILFYNSTPNFTPFQRKYRLKSGQKATISSLSCLLVCLILRTQPAFCTILPF